MREPLHKDCVGLIEVWWFVNDDFKEPWYAEVRRHHSPLVDLAGVPPAVIGNIQVKEDPSWQVPKGRPWLHKGRYRITAERCGDRWSGWWGDRTIFHDEPCDDLPGARRWATHKVYLEWWGKP